MKPVVLLYHDVVRSELRDEVGFPGPLAARYKLEPAVFEAHLDAIARIGRNVGLPSQEGAPDVMPHSESMPHIGPMPAPSGSPIAPS